MKKLLLPLLLSTTSFAESEWNTDIAYGCWADKHRCSNLALLHVQGTQRVIPGNDGTWLRAEISGSWELRGRKDLPGAASHADYFGPHNLYLPELALMQRFAGGRVGIVAGMVNLANDVDAVGIANDSFATFAHGALVNSSVLPLPDANAGCVLHVKLSENDHAVLAVSRAGSPPGGNPFRSGPPGCCIVGEYAHVFQDSAATLRINPFYHHHHAGLAGSVEYEASDRLTLFARSGFGTGGGSGTTADFSCGATLYPIPSRPDDFIGLAYGYTQNDGRENVLEAVYCFQMTDCCKLMPHVQYIRTPGHGDCFIVGVQAVVSF